MNKKKEKQELDNLELITIALPKSLIKDSIAEAESRNYGQSLKALQFLIHEQLLPFTKENIQKRKELS
jgi:hypothetical protein